MKRIPLTQGQFALVDDEDYDMLMQFKWCANYNPCMDSYYAVRHATKNHKKMERMHRVVLNVPTSKHTDHINHDTLDNRKCNLRIVTCQQNIWNRKPNKKETSSKYKGVYLQKKGIYEYWVARICINDKVIHVGSFRTELEGAIAYNKKAKELFGEYALLNKI